MKNSNSIEEAEVEVLNPELNETSAYRFYFRPVNVLPEGSKIKVKIPVEL